MAASGWLALCVLASGCGAAIESSGAADTGATAAAIVRRAEGTATALSPSEGAGRVRATARASGAAPPRPTPSAAAQVAGPSASAASRPPATGPTRAATPGPLVTADAADATVRDLYVDAAAQGYAGANLRREASTESEAVLVIPNGAVVRAEAWDVRTEEGAWRRVRYGSNQGYVLGSLLSPRARAEETAARATEGPAGERSAGFFPLHPAAPEATRERLAELLPGERAVARLSVHYAPARLPDNEADAFANDAWAAAGYVERLLGVRLRGRVDYYLAYAAFPPPDLGLRGYTSCGRRTIFQVLDGGGTRLDRQYLAAHELTHQLACDGIGVASSVMLSEGLAMYAAQRYLVADGQVSLDGFARAALEQGELIPLARLEDGGTRFLGRLLRRHPYDQSGSFVQYLIERYGPRRFERAYVGGEYEAVYGRGLEELEAGWLRYLRGDRAVGPFAPDAARYLAGIRAVQDGYRRYYEALGEGRAVGAEAFGALDRARTAADRAESETVERELRVFERSFPAR